MGTVDLQTMKKMLHKILRSCGYDIYRLDRFSADPGRDLRRIFGVHPVEVIFDVGANEGQSAVEYAAVFPEATIHSFEPFKVAFGILRRTTQSFNNVKPVNIALGDVTESRKLFVNKSSTTNSLLPNSPEAQAFVLPNIEMTTVSTTMIQVETLDDYCANNHIEFVDLLKMDVQGYEQRVLRGGERMLSQGKVAAVFTEVLFAPIYDGQAYFHDLYIDLWKCGFRLTYIYNLSPNSRHYLSWCDALFIHPDVLARRLLV